MTDYEYDHKHEMIHYTMLPGSHRGIRTFPQDIPRTLPPMNRPT